jgi:hypothetical protein
VRIGVSCAATGCTGGLCVRIIFVAAPCTRMVRLILPTGDRADFEAFFAAERTLFVLFLAVRLAVLVDRPAVFAECLLIISI